MGGSQSKVYENTKEVRDELKSITLKKNRLTADTFHKLKPYMTSDYGPADSYICDIMNLKYPKCGKLDTEKLQIERPLVFWSKKQISPHLPSFKVCKQEKNLHVLQDSKTRYTLKL